MRSGGLWPAKPTIGWMAAAGAAGGLGWAASSLPGARPLTEWFFYEQDLAAALVTALLLVAAWAAPKAWTRRSTPEAPPLAAVAALMAAVAACAGWRLVMQAYPLSMDEFMARWDAAIFSTGRLFATVPSEWRPLRFLLQPQFNLLAPDGASWASSYLPVNAMVLAGFAGIGSAALAGGFWILVTAASVWGLARRLWPERRDAATVAVVLLVTGAQTLLTAMTPYAMSAHMALNMVWLWLLLREDRASQIGAALVAFAACGLHQVVFHPLFAAPFVAQLWLSKRWGRATFHTLAYALIGLFWLSYWRIALPEGPAGAAGGGGTGLGIWLTRLELVSRNADLAGFGMMAKNLFRFLVWQNPAATALALTALWPAMRSPGVLRGLAGGMALTTVAVAVIMPYQGHGWGYRYLHGHLGALALLAASAWIPLTATADRRAALGTGVAALTAGSVLVLVPLRAWQASGFIRPYARAEAAIARAGADIVVVDTTNLAFGNDLVRNDPFLRNRPKMLDLAVMRPEQAAAVCSRGRVLVFDRESGSQIRPMRYARPGLLRMAAARRALVEAGCAEERIVLR